MLTLSIKQVVCLSVGRLKADSTSDDLLVGTTAEIRAYSVQDNADIFCREAPDGCTALAVGMLGRTTGQQPYRPLVFVGGSCSIYGYDANGDDAFWTVRINMRDSRRSWVFSCVITAPFNVRFNNPQVTGDNVASLAVAPVMNSEGRNEVSTSGNSRTDKQVRSFCCF
jgi:hypothetical protein